MTISCKICGKPFSSANDSQVLMLMKQHLAAHPAEQADLTATIRVMSTYFLIRMFVMADPSETEFIKMFQDNETAILELFANPAARPVD